MKHVYGIVGAVGSVALCIGFVSFIESSTHTTHNGVAGALIGGGAIIVGYLIGWAAGR